MIVYNTYIKKIFVVSKIVFEICLIVMILSFVLLPCLDPTCDDNILFAYLFGPLVSF